MGSEVTGSATSHVTKAPNMQKVYHDREYKITAQISPRRLMIERSNRPSTAGHWSHDRAERSWH